MFLIFVSFIRIGQIVMERGIRPWLRFDWMYKFSALGRENLRCVKALHDFTNKVSLIGLGVSQILIFREI
jgi:hypothetical protein